MAKRTTHRKSTPQKLFRASDIASWNFVIFLTLGFILLVVVLAAMKGVTLDLRAKAGLSCPTMTSLPKPEDCPGGVWKYSRTTESPSCPIFTCSPTN